MSDTTTLADLMPRAEPSDGTQAPMVRHIVRNNPETGAAREDMALCGRPWDRYRVSPGPLCDGCKAVYRRLHPTWPFPGGAA